MNRRRPAHRALTRRLQLSVVLTASASLGVGLLAPTAFAVPASWHKAPKPDSGSFVTVAHGTPTPHAAAGTHPSWSPVQAILPSGGIYKLTLAAAPPTATSARAASVQSDAATSSSASWSPIGTSGLAARTNSQASQQISVAVLSASQRKQRGLNGLALQIQRTTGAAELVQLRIPSATLNNLYGADYAGRVHWMELPVTGSGPAIAVPSTGVSKDASGNTLISAPISLRATVLAATSGPVSVKGSGSWAATDLKPSSQWGVSAQTGSFTYSYPMATPPAAAGPAPNLALAYDSGSVDGETGSTNNQPSQIGEGWSLTGGGFIERRYVSCSEDTGLSGAVATSGDLCWKSDNGELSFAGHSGTLVKDGNPGEFRLQDDDGTIVKELTTCTAVTARKDCWEVITTDGTQYYFGMNHLPGYTNDTATAPTNSVWTVPVYGNDDGEPGYNGTGGSAKGTFATEATTEAWRWNLDYVVDPHGNAEALYYDKPETNYYAQNGSGATSYIRGGELVRIDYGMQSGAVYTAGGPADRVTLSYVERCKTGNTCSSSTPTTMPDVPWDQNCTASPCTGKVSPTFWSEKMLASVATSVRTSATGYSTVNNWALTHDYPATNDPDNPPALWLSQIQQTASVSGSGTNGGSITLAPTVFKPTANGMNNRVDAASEGLSNLAKLRLSEIDTSTGAIDAIQYAPTDPACTYSYGQTTLKTNPDTDTHRCFLQWWTPQVTPPQPAQPDLFHKYVVQIVTEDPHTGGTGDLRTETDYSYGTPAWRYDNSPFVNDKYRGWSVFAGFNSAEIRKGDSNSPSLQQVTDYTYFQGMDGDRTASGGTRSAVVTDSSGTTVPDSRWLAGQTRETITPNPAGGTPLSDVLSTPWASSVHATDGTLQSRIVGDGEVKTTTPLSTGGTQVVDVHTSHDDNTGLVRTVSNDSTDAGSTCTRTDYAQNTTSWLMDYPSEIATVGVPCGSTPTYPGDAISDIRTSYDNGAWASAPSKGDPTSVQKVTGYTGTTAGTATWLVTATNVYDSLGRVTQVTDQRGRVNKTAYNPDTNGNNQTTQPVTAVTTTTDAQTGGLQWVSKASYNPAWNAQISATDLNNEVTTINYDALGRRSQVWLPDRSQASNPSSPSIKYGYTDYVASAPANLAVATTKLTPSGATITSYAIYDGLDRPRQTQSWSESKDSSGSHITAGTLISGDTMYDAAGRAYLTSSPYAAINTSPSAVVIVPQTTVPAQIQTTFDAAGRKTADIQLIGNSEVWRTSYAYSGADRVDTTPPAGGTPTSTFADARGRTTQLWQYDNATPTGTPLVTSYGYDARGDMTSMIDASRHTNWIWKFDVLGRQYEAIDPDTGTTDTSYDNADRVQSVQSDQRLTTGTQPARVTLAYSYDDADRKTGEYLNNTGGTQLAGWTYDTVMKGQLSSSASYVGTDTFTNAITSYDVLYRPKTTKTTIPTDATVTGTLAGTYTHTISYNADGSTAQVTDPGMGGLPFETLKTHYTELGNPYSYGGFSAYLADDSYTNTNLISQELISDGNSEEQRTFYYSTGLNRLTRLLTTTSASTHFTPADNNYTYDNAGNVTSDATYADAGTTIQCYNYDHLAELTAAWTLPSGSCGSQPTAAATVGGLAPYWTTYQYDETTGNRTSIDTHNLTGGSDTTATYNYPAAGSGQPHVLGTITYSGGRTGSDTFVSDPAGESTTRPGQALTYTPQGRLSTVTVGGTTQSNIYDADGNLLLTTDPGHGNTLYLGDTQLHTPAGQPAGTVTGVRTYTILGTPIAERSTTVGGPTNGTLVWLNADRNNTVTDELNNLTLATTTRHFDPFGGPVGGPPVWTSTHTYLNGDSNPQTSTVHLGARDYDPNLGRFLTADPVFDPADPLQDNGYSYSRNDPVGSSDPSGRHQECDGPCHGTENSAGSPAKATGLVGGPGGSGPASKIQITTHISVATGNQDSQRLVDGIRAYAASIGYVDGYGTQEAQAKNETLLWSAFCNTKGASICGNSLRVILSSLYWSVTKTFTTGDALGQLVVGDDPQTGELGVSRSLADVPLLQEVGAPPPSAPGPRFYRHYTDNAGAEGITKSGSLKPGVQSGKIWLTTDQYSDGVEARSNLALNKTPTGYFEIDADRIDGLDGPSDVKPWNGEPGGGIEYTTPNPIDMTNIPFVPFDLSGE